MGGSDGGKIKGDSVGNFFFFWCGESVVSVLKAWFTIYKAVFSRRWRGVAFVLIISV